MSEHDPDKRWDFLASCSGVIHVGAHVAQERDIYSLYDLPVVWIDAMPNACKMLVTDFADDPTQKVIQALLTDRDGYPCDLHVSNNNGASSSILDLLHHRELWPDVEYLGDIHLTTSTLPIALENAAIDCRVYDALVIDTQGSELLVLRGAEPILSGFKWIMTEAAEFEAYKGCATVSTLVEYLRPLGFRILRKDAFAAAQHGMAYYDLLFVGDCR